MQGLRCFQCTLVRPIEKIAEKIQGSTGRVADMGEVPGVDELTPDRARDEERDQAALPRRNCRSVREMRRNHLGQAANRTPATKIGPVTYRYLTQVGGLRWQ